MGSKIGLQTLKSRGIIYELTGKVAVFTVVVPGFAELEVPAGRGFEMGYRAKVFWLASCFLASG